MLYRVYAQKLPVERDGQSVRLDGSIEQLYKANLEHIATIQVERSYQAFKAARRLTPCPVLALAVH